MDIVITDTGRRGNPLLQRIKLVRGNIAEQAVDAVVSVVPQNLEFSGDINKALNAACGVDLDEFILDNLYKPRIGDVYSAPGFKLPCKNIFFGILPYWKGDFEREDVHLLTVCRKAMEMMPTVGAKSIAFPPLASGKNAYPKARAARLIVQGIVDRMHEDVEEVRIVCGAETTAAIFRERLTSYGWQELNN